MEYFLQYESLIYEKGDIDGFLSHVPTAVVGELFHLILESNNYEMARRMFQAPGMAPLLPDYHSRYYDLTRHSKYLIALHCLIEDLRRVCVDLSEDDFLILFKGIKNSRCSLNERKSAVDVVMATNNFDKKILLSARDYFVFDRSFSSHDSIDLWFYIRVKTQ